MTQNLRPNSTITSTGFTGNHASINSEYPDDSSYAWGEVNTAAVLEVGLQTPPETPGAGTCTVRFRIAKTNSTGTLDGGGNSVSITLRIYQGATLIATSPATPAVGTWGEWQWAPSLSTVTDWSSLRLRFTTSASGGSDSNMRGAAVSWAVVEVANAIVGETYPITVLNTNVAQSAQSPTIEFISSGGTEYTVSGNNSTHAAASGELELGSVVGDWELSEWSEWVQVSTSVAETTLEIQPTHSDHHALGGSFSFVASIQTAHSTHPHYAPQADVSGGSEALPGDGVHSNSTDGCDITGASTLSIDATGHSHHTTQPTVGAAWQIGASSSSHDATSGLASLAVEHSLFVDSTSHAHSSTVVSATTGATVSLSDAGHLQFAENPPATSAQTANIEGGAHVTESTVAQMGSVHGSVVSSGAHGHVVDVAGVSLSSSALIPDSEHSHDAGHLAPATTSSIICQDALAGAFSQTPSVVYSFSILVDGCAHHSTADGAIISAGKFFDVQDTSHGAIDLVGPLSIATALEAQSSEHPLGSTSPSVEYSGVAVAAGASHQSESDSAHLSTASEGPIASVAHVATSDALVVGASSTAPTTDCNHITYSTNSLLSTTATLDVDPCIAAQNVDVVEFSGGISLDVSSATGAQSVTVGLLSFGGFVGVEDAAHPHTSPLAELAADMVVGVGDAEHQSSTQNIQFDGAVEISIDSHAHVHWAQSVSIGSSSTADPHLSSHATDADSTSINSELSFSIEGDIILMGVDVVDANTGATIDVSGSSHGTVASPTTLESTQSLNAHDATSAHVAGSASIGWGAIVTPSQSTHATASPGVVLESLVVESVVPDVATHGSTATELTPTSIHGATIIGDTQTHHATSPVIGHVVSVVVDGVTHAHSVGAIGLNSDYPLDIGVASHGASTGAIALDGGSFISPSNATHSHLTDGGLATNANTVVDGVLHGVFSPTVDASPGLGASIDSSDITVYDDGDVSSDHSMLVDSSAIVVSSEVVTGWQSAHVIAHSAMHWTSATNVAVFIPPTLSKYSDIAKFVQVLSPAPVVSMDSVVIVGEVSTPSAIAGVRTDEGIVVVGER